MLQTILPATLETESFLYNPHFHPLSSRGNFYPGRPHTPLYYSMSVPQPSTGEDDSIEIEPVSSVNYVQPAAEIPPAVVPNGEDYNTNVFTYFNPAIRALKIIRPTHDTMKDMIKALNIKGVQNANKSTILNIYATKLCSAAFQ